MLPIMEEKRTFSWKDSVIQFLKFVFFSLGAGIIEFGSFELLRAIYSERVYLLFAEVLSVALSCAFNYTINRKYTFKSSQNIVVGMILYGCYYLVATPLGYLFIAFLVDSGWNEELAKATKMIVNFIFDFSFCKFVIFQIGKNKKPKDPDAIEK